MKHRLGRWTISLFATGFLIGFTTLPAQAWNSVSGEAFGVSVNVSGPLIPTGVVIPRTPDVILPPDGGMVEDQVLTVSVPDILVSRTLTVMTSGAIAASKASAQSSATVEQLDIRNGLVTARLVVAMASSTANGSTATSNAEGSTLVGLTVNGMTLGDITPAPNTTIPIPGVGSVILNEQIRSGDGVYSTALTVNMIHVVLNGTLNGDIIVASAHSDVNFTLAPPPPPATGFMTGGGRLGTGKTIATFGFNAGPDLRGQLQYMDHAQGLNVHSTGLTSYSSLGGTCVKFSGSARVNNTDGFQFTVTQACDNGEPGVGRDTFSISVTGPGGSSYSSEQSLGMLLTGGNLQLH
jgi:hypothetical protein